jgi:L-ascorbate metabolism protein UlaG (beta-lactamase superfamily)
MKRLLAVLVAGVWCGLLAGGAFAADGKVHVQWLGQASTKITTPTGKVIVIDPWLIKNPKTPEKYKDLNALGHVDFILVTHAHYDHVADAPALSKLNKAPVWGPAGLDDVWVKLEILPVELAPRMNKSGIAYPLGPDVKISITPVHAEHSSELTAVDPLTGKERLWPAGEPVGWIIKLENGYTIYHMGDTGLFTDMKFIADYYKPDLILMPIGGHFVMGPVEAAYATKNWLHPHDVIPIHYGTIPLLKGTPKEYMDALGQTSTKVHAINPGDELTF